MFEDGINTPFCENNRPKFFTSQEWGISECLIIPDFKNQMFGHSCKIISDDITLKQSDIISHSGEKS